MRSCAKLKEQTTSLSTLCSSRKLVLEIPPAFSPLFSFTYHQVTLNWKNTSVTHQSTIEAPTVSELNGVVWRGRGRRGGGGRWFSIAMKSVQLWFCSCLKFDSGRPGSEPSSADRLYIFTVLQYFTTSFIQSISAVLQNLAAVSVNWPLPPKLDLLTVWVIPVRMFKDLSRSFFLYNFDQWMDCIAHTSSYCGQMCAFFPLKEGEIQSVVVQQANYSDLSWKKVWLKDEELHQLSI